MILYCGEDDCDGVIARCTNPYLFRCVTAHRESAQNFFLRAAEVGSGGVQTHDQHALVGHEVVAGGWGVCA